MILLLVRSPATLMLSTEFCGGLLGQFGLHSGNPDYDWNYKTIPQKHSNNRSFIWPSGRLLGGNSAINFFVRLRLLQSISAHVNFSSRRSGPFRLSKILMHGRSWETQAGIGQDFRKPWRRSRRKCSEHPFELEMRLVFPVFQRLPVIDPWNIDKHTNLETAMQ